MESTDVICVLEDASEDAEIIDELHDAITERLGERFKWLRSEDAWCVLFAPGCSDGDILAARLFAAGWLAGHRNGKGK